MNFLLDGENYPIIIDRKFGQKNTYIRVKKDLKIYVSTGKLTSNRAILDLIKANYHKIEEMIIVQKKKKENNDGFYFLGKKYEIKYILEDDFYFEDNIVYMNKDYDIYKFYKREANKLFQERLEFNFGNFTKKIPQPKLRIRKMTSRWGVCNIKTHIITLNLELIKRDIEYLDYVIIHELTHLVHGDHSREFWSVVEENMPNYKKYRKEMKEF